MKCLPSPHLELSYHHLLPRRAITPCPLPITIFSFPYPSSPRPRLNSAAGAAAARRPSSSPATKSLRYRSTAPRTPPTHQTGPEERAPEVLPSSSTATTCSDGFSGGVVLAAASLGVAAVFLLGVDGKEALALGPEGPLVEEFWDNMRRYGLYILTVSTGAIYTILQPIVELLKNPISAILILLILGGSFYLLSQVLSLMVGINEFSYDYAN